AAANTPTCGSCSLLAPDCCTVLSLPGQILSGTCPNCSSNLITNELTSGYYAGLTLQGVLPEDRTKPIATKCSHGGPFDFTTTTLDGGINKDSRDCGFSPHATYHNIAADVATDASYQFVLDLKDALTAKNGISVATRQLKSLLGVGPT